ncbi:MAG: phthalate 4,5-dioxygenase [Chloroflexi bacterium]|nr:phthalate 4,5-dioxygenase [Chloroflexota bacterium]
MLTSEENELLTRTGPGTPGGNMIRCFWQPVALSAELPSGGAPVPIRILGEDLVIFRDERGQPGLLGIHCAHRGADLSYGRIEDGGLRCIYHGWLYDTTGRCLEQPGEPVGSTFHERIRHRAYPCHEAGGAIFAYMGTGEPPLFPDYEFFQVPDSHRWVHKYFHECNYLQGNEGNMDPSHPFFLHHFLPGSALQRSRVPVDDHRVTPAYNQEVHAPLVRAEEVEFGVRIYALYPATDDWTDVRVSHFVMPNTSAVGGGPVPPGDGCLMNWHVPSDDTHHWRFSMAFKRSGPLDPRHAAERASVTGSDYRFARNLSNRYLQDRNEQRTDTFAGMGPIFVVQDSYATETAGPIQDRTEERLGSCDAGVALARRMLLRAIQDVQEGRDPPHVIRRPEQNRLEGVRVTEERIPASMTWDAYRKARSSDREPTPSMR